MGPIGIMDRGDRRLSHRRELILGPEESACKEGDEDDGDRQYHRGDDEVPSSASRIALWMRSWIAPGRLQMDPLDSDGVSLRC